MNWEAIGAIGEILGAVAVLITLIYLAIQIRLNTLEIRAGRVESTLKDQAKYNEFLASDADLARIYWTAIEDIDKLNENEKRRWLHLCSIMLRNSEVAYYHHRQGYLPEDIHQSRERWIRLFMGTSGFRWWWKQYASILDPEFVQYVESITSVAENDPD